jgi:DNA replication initiation complex subunit (GINS family)
VTPDLPESDPELYEAVRDYLHDVQRERERKEREEDLRRRLQG